MAVFGWSRQVLYDSGLVLYSGGLFWLFPDGYASFCSDLDCSLEFSLDLVVS